MTRFSRSLLSLTLSSLFVLAPTVHAKSQSTTSMDSSFSAKPVLTLPTTPGNSIPKDLLSDPQLDTLAGGGAECETCYPKNLRGMRDSSVLSVQRSMKEGSALQYVVGNQGVQAAGVDTDGLAQDLNDFIRVSGLYFKSKPELKGVFKSIFIYYPGKDGKPYQIQIEKGTDSGLADSLKDLNANLAQGTNCNAEKVCSVFAAMGFAYQNPAQPTQSFDKQEFAQFVNKNSTTQDHKFYHTNKNYQDAITLILYQGTNGYYIDKSYVEQDVKRLSTKNLR